MAFFVETESEWAFDFDALNRKSWVSVSLYPLLLTGISPKYGSTGMNRCKTKHTESLKLTPLEYLLGYILGEIAQIQGKRWWVGYKNSGAIRKYL